MSGVAQTRRPWVDGALPLLLLVAPALAVEALHPALYALAALYLTFAAGMASGGAERPGEPQLPWRLYALGTASLAVLVPLGAVVAALEPLVVVPLAIMAVGFVAHTRAKLAHGVHRAGVLSAGGRRAHDARVGRTVEATALVLAAAAVAAGPASPALYAVGGWLLTAASVAEREPVSSAREDQPPAAAPAPAA